jgi:hypothetical protein
MPEVATQVVHFYSLEEHSVWKHLYQTVVIRVEIITHTWRLESDLRQVTSVGGSIPGTRCASSTHNDDGASSFSEI